MRGCHGNVTRSTSGFSLIELVMVIGVVMVLVALAAPALGRVMFTARSTRYAAAISQNAKLLTVYTAQYRDIAPIGDPGAEANRTYWVKAVLAAGLIQSLKEIDPDVDTDSYPLYMMNRALCDRVEDLTPGQTEPMDWAQCDPVRYSAVVYPSSLIVLSKIQRKDHELPWCCFTHVRSYPGPVAFADGHVETGYWTDFIAEDELFIENNVGWPAYSTWSGHRGRSKK